MEFSIRDALGLLGFFSHLTENVCTCCHKLGDVAYACSRSSSASARQMCYLVLRGEAAYAEETKALEGLL